MTRRFRSLLFLSSCVAASLAAQSFPQSADSTTIDTLVVRMMDGIGDAFPGRTAGVLADSQWHWSEARTIPDAFSMIPGIYQFEQGGEGNPVSLWHLGAGPEVGGMSIDGIPVGTQLFDANAITLFPLEFIQDIEELRGPSALLTGTRWNLRSHQYASAKPRTAVRFVQSPNETIFSDGLFSQNIARSTNLHVGFQRRTSDGRFANAGLDSWALRGRLRYNVTPWLNLMGTWRYEKTSNGSNGGIDRARSATIFDEVSAVVIEPDAYELRTSTSLAFHALADVFGDSLSLTRLTVSSTEEEREFHRPVATPYHPMVREFALSDRSQVRLEQALRVPWFTLRGMGQLDLLTAADSTVLRGVERSLTAVGGSIEANIIPGVTPSVGVRLDRAPEGTRTSVAAAVDIRLAEGLTISGSLDRRSMLPGLRQMAWNDSLILHPSAGRIGTDQFAVLGVVWEFMDASFITLEGFRREQTDRLFYVPDSTPSGTGAIGGRYLDASITGFQASGRLTLRPFYVSGWVSLMQVDGNAAIAEMHPKAWARWEGGWKGRLFDDELGLQVTLRGMFFDRHEGFTLDPRSGLQYLQSSVLIGRMTRLDGLIVMDIGSAFVTLSWENILNTNYYKLGTYPLLNRTFRLGVRWNFLE